MTTIPFGELDAIAPSTRRTLVLRVLLGLAAVAAGAVVVMLSRGEAAPQALLPAGSDGLVVLDLSASISSDTYARIGGTLDRLADSGGRYGLIIFSDTAYLALPPGTPAAQLEPFARRFDVPARTTGAITVPTNPWTRSFSAGTKISTGLQLALDTIREQRLGRPAVLLVSDLDDDAGDRERMTSTALSLRRLGVPVRVVGLNPSPEDERYMERLLNRPADLSPAALPGEERGGGSGLRLPLFLAALGAAAALALREAPPYPAGARVRRSRLRLAALALAAAIVLLALGLTARARSGDADARLRAAVHAYEVAAGAGRSFDNGLTRANLRSRAQALLTDVAIGNDHEAAAQADVLLGVLAASGGRSAAGETPDELSRNLFETAVRLDNRNVAAKFDLELAVRRLRAVGARTGAGQGSGPRGSAQRGAGAGQPGRGY